jgi:ubiquinone/menaquinone biosynthesis C-methylase UbiE
MSINGINQQVVEAFTGRMLDILNSGSLALMTSIGHRTGLFDTMAGLPPATSGQIAEATGLQERYVREWLGAMVVGRVVDYDPDTATYWLPPEHAAALTRVAAPNNVAAFMQYIGLLGSVEDGIVASFRHGGGVPYSAYPRFHDVMAEDSGQSVLPALLDHILPLVPGLVEALQRGIEVLDLGCGRGKALILMAENFPNSRFTGYDFSENAIAAARAEAQQKGLSNIRFEVQDAAILEETQRYDFITTFDAVHDQAKPAAVLGNIQRALKADGVYLMQDIAGSSHVHNNLDHPMGQFLYTVSCMHCMTVSLAYGGEGLGAMWGREKALQMLAEAGFANVEVKQLAHDVQNDYYICRKR